jgi:hypothetical protein
VKSRREVLDLRPRLGWALSRRALLAMCVATAVSAMAACGSDNNGTGPRTLATITVAPSPDTLAVGATQQFTATGKDANGNSLAISPTWSVVSGGGTITADGVFTAGASGGEFPNTVQATSGGVTGTATVVVTVPSVPGSLVGSYTLQTMDGKAPPDTVVHTSTVTVEFLDGTLNLNSDSTYKLFFHSRTTTNGTAQMDTSGSVGTYSASGNSVTITKTGGGSVVATADLPDFTFTDNGHVFLFRKE